MFSKDTRGPAIKATAIFKELEGSTFTCSRTVITEAESHCAQRCEDDDA